MSQVKAVVLAAGQGKRMRGSGDLPKVLQPACGRPLLSYVLRALSFLPKRDVVIVVGFQKEKIINEFGKEYTYAVQEQQLGTGHAVLSAEKSLLGFRGQIIVCCGDMPLIRQDTYKKLLETHQQSNNVCTFLSGTSNFPLSYGRIVRDSEGNFTAVVEQGDCTEEQRKITEMNAGIYVFESGPLWEALSKLQNKNSQHEYYLTDVPLLLRESGGGIGVYRSTINEEILGINTPEQLELVEYRIREANLLF